MVSVKTRLGVVKKEEPERTATVNNSIRRNGGSSAFGATFINGYLGGGATKPKVTKPVVRKNPLSPKVTQVSLKSGSLIQVVKKETDVRKRIGTATGRRRSPVGGMRSDEIQSKPRKTAFSRTKMENFKLSVKRNDDDLLGIDLKSISLKRKIANENAGPTKVENSKWGNLKRTVDNKVTDSESEEEPEKPKRKIKQKKNDRALYKSALNDVLENKKRARSAIESRKRASRKKVADMESDNSSDDASPKKKSRRSKAKENEKEDDFVPVRRPGERGKSAAKEQLDSDEESHSPIEGYRLEVTNLNASVSESDLIDLFCAIGAVRDARLQSSGVAIVTFVKRAAAMAAITKYNGRELDGQKITVNPFRIMELPRKHPYQWRNEYPTKKPRVRQDLVGEITSSILLPAIAGTKVDGMKPVVFTVKV